MINEEIKLLAMAYQKAILPEGEMPRFDYIDGEWVKRDFHDTEPSEPNPDYVDSTDEPLIIEFTPPA